MKFRALLVGVAAAPLLAAVCAAPAFSAEAAAPAAEPATGLAEIVVTARKTSETLVHAPLSVTALSAEELKARDINNYVSLQNYTPGFKFINQSVNRNDRGYSSFIMRGMNPGTPVSKDQAVSVFLDGVPLAGGVIDGLTDVDRVEVVKGPQSAYFGRSTFAGAINFILREPSFTPQSHVDAKYATYGTYDVNAETEGALVGDVLAGRLGVRTYHTNGQFKNPQDPSERLGEQNTYSVTGQLLFKPTSNLTIKTFAKYFHDNDGPAATGYIYPSQYNCAPGAPSSAIQFVNGLNYVCGKLPSLNRASLGINTAIPSVMYGVLNGQVPALLGGVYRLGDMSGDDKMDHFGLERSGYSFHTSAHYDLPADFSVDANFGLDRDNYQFLADIATKDLRSTPNPNYGSSAPQFSPINTPGFLPYSGAWAHGMNDDNDVSSEVRLNSPQSGRLKGMLGFSWFHQRTKAATMLYNNGGYSQISAYAGNYANTSAIFGSLSYDITDELNLSFEAREQWDRIRAHVFRGDLQFEQTFPSFSPRVILSYHPDTSTTLYASFAKGSRPGVFNTQYAALPPASQAAISAVAPVQLAVPEEQVKMYEVGLKTRFLDNRAQILAAAYYGDWTGRHISDKVYYPDPTNPSNLSNTLFTIAGGVTKVYGVELEGDFQATPDLLLEATWDFAGTKIKKDYCGDCLLITGDPNPVNTRMPGYPVTSGSFSATYTHPIFGDKEGFLRLEYIYTGKVYVDDSNVSWIGPSSKVNFHLGYKTDRYRLEVFGTNITNDDTYLFAQRYSDSLPAAGSGLTTQPVNEISVSPPEKATYGVRVSVDF